MTPTWWCPKQGVAPPLPHRHTVELDRADLSPDFQVRSPGFHSHAMAPTKLIPQPPKDAGLGFGGFFVFGCSAELSCAALHPAGVPLRTGPPSSTPAADEWHRQSS